MGKITVTVCDSCGEQLAPDDALYKVTLQRGIVVYTGDLCETCIDATNWHLPERKKRKQYNKATA